MKTNCNGCRALEYTSYNYSCRLGYKIITRPVFKDIPEGIPQEECPKPLTYDRFIAIIQDRQNAEIYLQRYKK